MSAETIRIFVHGRGTHVFFVKGVGRIQKAGRGRFLDQTFLSLNEAQEFGRAQVAKDENAILYLLRGDDVLETLLDPARQDSNYKKARLIESLISMIPFAAISIWLCLKTAPFASDSANLTLAGAMILVHALILHSHNWNWFEATVAMAIFLVFAFMVCGALHKARMRREKRQHQPTALMAHPWNSTCVKYLRPLPCIRPQLRLEVWSFSGMGGRTSA